MRRSEIAAIITGAAVLFGAGAVTGRLIEWLSAAHGAEPPYSCRLYYEAERNCGAFGNCDRKALEYWRQSCLRDRGRP
jgi:hypothetical protein